MTYSQYPTITKVRNSRFSTEMISKDSYLNTKDSALTEMNNKLMMLSETLPSLYSSDVRPVQCDNSIATLNEFLKIIRRLCTSIEKLPLQLGKQTNKYKLSTNLYYLEDQIIDLYSLIKTLRPICREEVNRKTEIQLEIRDQFRKILEISERLT